MLKTVENPLEQFRYKVIVKPILLTPITPSEDVLALSGNHDLGFELKPGDQT
jgi:hypothetical protein